MVLSLSPTGCKKETSCESATYWTSEEATKRWATSRRGRSFYVFLYLKFASLKHQETKKEQRKNDPWSKYMDEVKKYKQQSCTDDKSSRTL
ncbi:hypothetical protein Avbf_17091 [Armadillidium vulgare]|nr:hypothetical protein Avbf_17091 [Armadillidium vulgare]